MFVDELIERKDPGVNVFKLKAGSKIVVKTYHSTYVFVTTHLPRELDAKGGRHIPKTTRVFLAGSTWGGSCLKLGWIGINMNMEIILPSNKKLLTSPVSNIRIIGSNKDWFYDLS